jgi:hypothetical protein
VLRGIWQVDSKMEKHMRTLRSQESKGMSSSYVKVRSKKTSERVQHKQKQGAKFKRPEDHLDYIDRVRGEGKALQFC